MPSAHLSVIPAQAGIHLHRRDALPAACVFDESEPAIVVPFGDSAFEPHVGDLSRGRQNQNINATLSTA